MRKRPIKLSLRLNEEEHERLMKRRLETKLITKILASS